MRKKLFGLAVVLALLATPFLSSESSAMHTDDKPCGPRYNWNGYRVQNCPMWRGWVPVHATPDPDSAVIGWLVDANANGGEGNFFTCQMWVEPPPEYTLPGTPYANNWYAFTLSDHTWKGGKEWTSKWGFVSEVYFSGGENHEADAGLRVC